MNDCIRYLKTYDWIEGRVMNVWLQPIPTETLYMIEKYIDNRKERCCDLHSYIYLYFIIEFNIYLLYYISIIIIKQKERKRMSAVSAAKVCIYIY